MAHRNSIIICSLLALGIAVLVLAGLIADGSNDDIVLNSNPGVLELIPSRGDEVIAQTNGGDYDDIVSEIAREQEVAKSLDVVLDKDLDLEVEIGSEGNVNITAPPATPSRSKKRKKSE